MAILIDENFAYSYNNQGLAKIKLSLLKEDLADIEKSLMLKSNNAYAYKNLGIYYYEKADYTEVAQQFLKAKEMDVTIDSIDVLIGEARSKIEII